MIAVDTNLLVRLATGDVPAEQGIATRLYERNDVLVLKTVLLETEWVLRSRYGYRSTDVCDFFEHLSGLATVVLEDERATLRAIAGARAGLDFADALHLASAHTATLYTLDRGLVRRMNKLPGAKARLAT